VLDRSKNGGSTSAPPVVGDDGDCRPAVGHVVKPRYARRKVAEALTREPVHTIKQNELGANPIARADKFFTDHPAPKLSWWMRRRLRGLFTMSDVERITQERSAQFKLARDARFRLVCGAAPCRPRATPSATSTATHSQHVGAWWNRRGHRSGLDRHGHSKGVGDTVRMLRDASRTALLAGNVTTAAGVEFSPTAAPMHQSWPGGSSAPRASCRVAFPAHRALHCSRAAQEKRVAIVADAALPNRGYREGLTLAHGVICGGLFAGCPEAPDK